MIYSCIKKKYINKNISLVYVSCIIYNLCLLSLVIKDKSTNLYYHGYLRDEKFTHINYSFKA